MFNSPPTSGMHFERISWTGLQALLLYFYWLNTSVFLQWANLCQLLITSYEHPNYSKDKKMIRCIRVLVEVVW